MKINEVYLFPTVLNDDVKTRQLRKDWFFQFLNFTQMSTATLISGWGKQVKAGESRFSIDYHSRAMNFEYNIRSMQMFLALQSYPSLGNSHTGWLWNSVCENRKQGDTDDQRLTSLLCIKILSANDNPSLFWIFLLRNLVRISRRFRLSSSGIPWFRSSNWGRKPVGLNSKAFKEDGNDRKFCLITFEFPWNRSSKSLQSSHYMKLPLWIK